MTDKLQKSSVSMRYRLKFAVSAISSFLFPPVCAGCSKVGYIICDDCFQRIHPSATLVYGNSGKTSNLSLRANPKQNTLNRVWATTMFMPPISDMIHKLKYNGQFAVARPLGNLMAEVWDTSQNNLVDLVIPIPLHPLRKKERGYNQSALLVENFCKATGLAYKFEVLSRIKYTTAQVRLNANSRASNVKNAFWANREEVMGQRLLLVDDVFTTGATMTEAANALFRAGAASVSGYCLAYAE